MGPNASIRRILEDFRERLRALYGPRLRDVILFGSYARGDAEEGSDVDLMVVLDDFADERTEEERVDPIAYELSLANDLVISLFVVRAEEYRERMSPLLLNVRREGVPI
jgi:predicted nucleotidyltransferase